VAAVIKRKRKLWSKYKRNRTQENLDNYKMSRNQVKGSIKRQISLYEQQLCSSSSSASISGQLYRYLNSSRSSRDKITKLKVDNKLISEEQECATAMNNYFVTVFNPPTAVDPAGQSGSDMQANMKVQTLDITFNDVYTQLSSLNVHKAGGPDLLPSYILKQCKHELSNPLMLLYNKSLLASELPQDWKDADILPIFKTGDKLECGNYRPISLTSIVVKVLEKLVLQRILEHVESNKLLHTSQFGFRKHRSCEMQLLLYTNFLVKSYDLKVPVHSIYLDLQKAFDKVPHAELLYKLQHYFGIEGQLLNWLRSFLTGRRQRVRIGQTYSSWEYVTSGVPQGTVIAPFLFILYVNDIQNGLNGVNILKFADDTKLYCSINDISDTIKLQSNLDLMGDWFIKWRMPVNVKKSGALKFGFSDNYPTSYSLYGEKLKELMSERDLGVIMDGSLSNKPHIQKIVNQAMRAYGWMVRNLVTRDRVVVLRVYKSLIRPILEYASSVWSPSRVGLMNKLERVQRKVTKLIYRDVPYSDRLVMLKLPSLRWRRNYLDMLRVYSIVHGDESLRRELITFSTEVSVSGASLRRHRHAIYKSNVHTDIYKHHFVNRVVDQWNSLPEPLLDIPQFSLFKKRLKEHLLTNGNIEPYIWSY
jgi:hypothetical protein